MQKSKLLLTIFASVALAHCGETAFNGEETQNRSKASNKNQSVDKATNNGITTNSGSPDSVDTPQAGLAIPGETDASSTYTGGNLENDEGYHSSNPNQGTNLDGSFIEDQSGQIINPQTPTTATPPKTRSELAIAHCLKAWQGAHPFGNAPTYRKVNVGALLGTVSLVWDQRSTSTPELVYIYSDFTNPLPAAAGSYTLQNPNGWYCLDVNFDRNNNWPDKSTGNFLGLPVPSIGDVGISTVMITCSARLAQVRHTGGDLSRYVNILRMRLIPPIPCLDGKDHLVKFDWSLPFVDVAGTIF